MVVFDMAGTTVDEQNLVYKTLHKAVNAAGFAIPYDQVLLFGGWEGKAAGDCGLAGIYGRGRGGD
ncbi:MAG: hypothetical protein RLZZ519_1816 [Bacteroidota bacterium]